jgi:hypothetical protein
MFCSSGCLWRLAESNPSPVAKTMCGAGYRPDGWRTERQDDNGPGAQSGRSLKDPLPVTSPLLQGAVNVRRCGIPILKCGFCVSTVSIVCGRARGSIGCCRGLTLLDRAAVGSTEDRNRYRGRC